MQALSGAQVLSSFDALAGFNQVEMLAVPPDLGQRHAGKIPSNHY
jgi:hypothetical protein